MRPLCPTCGGECGAICAVSRANCLTESLRAASNATVICVPAYNVEPSIVERPIVPLRKVWRCLACGHVQGEAHVSVEAGHHALGVCSTCGASQVRATVVTAPVGEAAVYEDDEPFVSPASTDCGEAAPNSHARCGLASMHHGSHRTRDGAHAWPRHDALPAEWESRTVVEHCDTTWTENDVGEVEHVGCCLRAGHQGVCVSAHGTSPHGDASDLMAAAEAWRNLPPDVRSRVVQGHLLPARQAGQRAADLIGEHEMANDLREEANALGTVITMLGAAERARR